MHSLQYHQAVQNYLNDNSFDFHVAGVRSVLRMAADTLDGLPDVPDGCYHLSQTNQVYWLVERHLVIYRRKMIELQVTEIKPLE